MNGGFPHHLVLILVSQVNHPSCCATWCLVSLQESTLDEFWELASEALLAQETSNDNKVCTVEAGKLLNVPWASRSLTAEECHCQSSRKLLGLARRFTSEASLQVRCIGVEAATGGQPQRDHSSTLRSRSTSCCSSLLAASLLASAMLVSVKTSRIAERSVIY